tara:strand:- start:918 stop:1655 length:738 start_codon:yes stop_codon:yes gene_type:complete
MNKLKQYIVLSFLTLVLFSSCTSRLKIQENLIANKQSIFYLSEIPKGEKKEGLLINSPSVRIDSALSKYTTVENQGSFLIPFLVFNYWEAQKECSLGLDALAASPDTSFKQNLLKDIRRSAIFEVDSLNGSEYDLEVSIDQISAKGPYNSQGFCVFALFFYFYSFGDYAGPAESTLSVSYKLKNSGKVVKSNSFSYVKEGDILNKGYKNKKELISVYSTSMAEATSHNYRNAIKDIIEDLNSYFQ